MYKYIYIYMCVCVCVHICIVWCRVGEEWVPILPFNGILSVLYMGMDA